MGQQTSAPPAHPAASPATANGGGGAAAAVTPAWSRPDDASRQAQLEAMKRRAAGPLGPAGAVVGAASRFGSPDSPARRGGGGGRGAPGGGARVGGGAWVGKGEGFGGARVIKKKNT